MNNFMRSTISNSISPENFSLPGWISAIFTPQKIDLKFPLAMESYIIFTDTGFRPNEIFLMLSAQQSFNLGGWNFQDLQILVWRISCNRLPKSKQNWGKLLVHSHLSPSLTSIQQEIFAEILVESTSTCSVFLVKFGYMLEQLRIVNLN